MLAYNQIDNSGFLLYKYIRGSHLYGLALDNNQSDIDTGAVYCAPIEHLIGTRLEYQDQIGDDKNDNVCYELEKYIRLLSNSNPNILESLFVPDEFILYKHPVMDLILDKKLIFLTKKCFKSFYSYAKSQICKAKSLHKMINMDKPKHKTILDFCYTPYKQGSTKITNWLAYRNMDQKYIGCVNINNMVMSLSLFYDWGAHILDHPYDFDEDRLKEHWEIIISGRLGENEQAELYDRIRRLENDPTESTPDNELLMSLKWQYNENKKIILIDFIRKTYNINTYNELLTWVLEQKKTERHYKGMVRIKENGNISDCLCMSSVLEGELPICIITCNTSGYSEHCKRYKEYYEWEQKRNPVRYESNLHKSYDAKNMMHCFRLIKMCIEIAKGEGCKLNRQNIDRDFLLDIRNHKFEYDELIEKLEVLCTEMDNAIAQSNIPDNIDEHALDSLCTKIRQIFWKSKEN